MKPGTLSLVCDPVRIAGDCEVPRSIRCAGTVRAYSLPYIKEHVGLSQCEKEQLMRFHAQLLQEQKTVLIVCSILCYVSPSSAGTVFRSLTLTSKDVRL